MATLFPINHSTFKKFEFKEDVFLKAVKDRQILGKTVSDMAKESMLYIIRYWIKRFPDGGDTRKLGYLLATAKHETAGTMSPAKEENLNYTTADRIVAVHGKYISKDDATECVGDKVKLGNKAYGGRNGNGPAETSNDGYDFRGRGFVHLTFRDNYRKWGIENAKENASLLPKATEIMVEGSLKGAFTNKGLDHYFGEQKADWLNARRVINGDVSAVGNQIANAAIEFSECLVEAGFADFARVCAV